jgi:hypothetical protein
MLQIMLSNPLVASMTISIKSQHAYVGPSHSLPVYTSAYLADLLLIFLSRTVASFHPTPA